MKNIVFIAVIYVCQLNAQDISLDAFFKDRIYYNLALNKDGKVLISSSDGVYFYQDSKLKKIDNSKGYIKVINNEIVSSKYSNDIKDISYNFLLPDIYKDLKHYALEADNYIYIVCKNQLFIFKQNKFKTHLRGASIRSITQNSVGTYSGIYCFGKKLDLPGYTSGYIREKDSIFYICYDGLAIYKPNDSLQLLKRDLTGETKIGSESLGYSRDIHPLLNGSYLLATTKGLFQLDKGVSSATAIYKEESKNGVEIIDVLDGSETLIVAFSVNGSLYEFSLIDKELTQLVSVKQNIEDGFKPEQDLEAKYIILTDNRLYSFADNSLELLVKGEFSSAYSLLPLEQNRVIVTTQNGAFHVNLNTLKTTKIFDGIEFNKRAVFRSIDSIKLGTTNGYISISNDQLDNLVSITNAQTAITKADYKYKLILILISFSLGLTLYLFFAKHRRNQESKTPTTVEIEAFIEQNLSTATIDTVASHFNLSMKDLYLIMENKPGKIISKKRKQKAKELFEQDESLDAIALKTGFSVSYLKRIKGSL